MNNGIESLTLVYFSPTGTTKKIVQSVANELHANSVEVVDITTVVSRNRRLKTSPNDLLIVGVPVYMGRVPAIATEWLQTLKASNTPAVCIVVYGNRAYENALLELNDILTDRGCSPIAGAAFVGEHSFSTSEYPIAAGRPDASDLMQAQLLGQQIKAKLDDNYVNEIRLTISIPGSKPYGGVTELWSVDFITISGCSQCGTCAQNCPTGAIDENTGSVDSVKCITCCACIKNCPENARKIKPSLVQDAAERLNNLFKDRKEPALFI